MLLPKVAKYILSKVFHVEDLRFWALISGSARHMYRYSSNINKKPTYVSMVHLPGLYNPLPGYHNCGLTEKKEQSTGVYIAFGNNLK